MPRSPDFSAGRNLDEHRAASTQQRCILVHGFNVRDDGTRSIGALAPYFVARGFTVKRFRYGWLFLLGVKLLNRRFARLLADFVEPGDVVVCHSNGAAIAHRAASEFFAPIAQLVLINPALDSDAQFPHQIEAIHIWHSPSDLPVRFARWIPFARWGDMGAVGYRGPYDRRVRNYNKEHSFPVSSKSHSDIFTGPRLKYFGPLIVAATIP